MCPQTSGRSTHKRFRKYGESSAGRPLGLRRQHSLPNLFLEGQGCVGPRLAQPTPLWFSPDRSEPTGNQANQGTEAQSSVCGPALEEPALVCGAVSAAQCSPVAHSTETRPPLSCKWNDLAPPARTMGATSLASRWEPSDLPEIVLNTISQARAPSTRRLYAVKWSVFSAWCTTRSADPVVCDISLILSFLQELLEKGRSLSTLKVYVAAIAASHAHINGQSVGRNNLVVRFLKGSRRLNPPHPVTIPAWDLPTALRALKSPPYGPLQSVDLRPLTLKTALLLALASVKRMGDLQALSVSPSCVEFGPNDSKIILKPRHGYIPKVLSTPFRAQVITLSALPHSEQDQSWIYSALSGRWEFIWSVPPLLTNRNNSLSLRLSRWIIDVITLAYSSLGQQCPMGVKAHSTRGIASSWVWFSGVSIAEICAAAGWASPSTFSRFYNLEVSALHARVLSA